MALLLLQIIIPIMQSDNLCYKCSTKFVYRTFLIRSASLLLGQWVNQARIRNYKCLFYQSILSLTSGAGGLLFTIHKFLMQAIYVYYQGSVYCLPSDFGTRYWYLKGHNCENSPNEGFRCTHPEFVLQVTRSMCIFAKKIKYS